MCYENVLATIGNTPLIKLSNICQDIPATIYGKVEAFNPGHSAKDRIALFMVDQAEKEGKINPGDTIVEATSGNTGYSLAMICSMKGYKCVLTVTSKASQAKLALLRSMGAKVVVCPANVEPTDPRSYYSRAEKIGRETPNAYYLQQNWNKGNQLAHYYSTGPEIWQQTQGRITHYVCCAGTGGTLSGTAQYLKEKNPEIKVIAVDAYGSVLAKYWETGEFDKREIFPYKVEGLGKTIIPDNVDFDIIDSFVKVDDQNSALRARQLARMEGLLLGYSSGAAMQTIFEIQDELSPEDHVVVLFPDHGSRYLTKIYNDEWMKQQGFLPGGDISTYDYMNYEYLRRVYKVYRRKYTRKYGKYLRQTFRIS